MGNGIQWIEWSRDRWWLTWPVAGGQRCWRLAEIAVSDCLSSLVFCVDYVAANQSGADICMLLTSGGNNFDDFPENQNWISWWITEFPNFIRAKVGNVKVINHRLCNCVCVLLHFDTKTSHWFTAVLLLVNGARIQFQSRPIWPELPGCFRSGP